MPLPSFRFATACLPVLATIFFARPLLAQPDTIPSSINPPPPAPPLTLDELQTLVGGPTLITFAGRGVPLADIVNVFQTAAGTREARPQTLREKAIPQTLNVDWKAVPFWDAAQSVEQFSGLRWSAGGANSLVLQPVSQMGLGNLNGRIAARAPLLKLVATAALRSSRSVTLLGEDGDEKPSATASRQLTLIAYFDPKLQVESSSLRALQFQNAEGIVSVPAAWVADLDSVACAGSSITPLALTLPEKLRTGSTLTSVKGILSSVVVLSTQTWKIADLSKVTQEAQTVGQARYTIEKVEITPTQLKLQINGQAPRLAGAVQSNRIFTRLRVRDAQGNVLRTSGSSISSNTTPDKRLTIQAGLTFQLPQTQGATAQDPFSLEWAIPTGKGTLEVPFELRNITVP